MGRILLPEGSVSVSVRPGWKGLALILPARLQDSQGMQVQKGGQAVVDYFLANAN